MPDRWDIYNETIGNIISEARSLTATEIMSLRSQLMDVCHSKKYGKKTQFSAEERIRLIHPNLLRGQILVYLLKNTKWENNPSLFTRKNLAEIFNRKESEVSRATKKLMQLGLINVHKEFFRDTWKFRLVYNLTSEGVWATRWLLKNKKRKVKVR